MRRPGPLLAALALVGAALGTGCGSCASSTAQRVEGDAAAVPEVDRGPTPADACLAYATAYCGRMEACTPFLLQAAYGDLGTCTQRMAKVCVPGMNAAGSQLTPPLMMSCASAVEAESCDDALDNPQPSACDVPGKLPMWAPCGASSQCGTGYCKMTSGVCGTCTQRVGATAPCTVDADCSATLVCHLGTCVGPGGIGSPCGPTSACLRTLTCIAGKCAAPVTAGGPCTAATDCDGAHGAYCNLQTKLCELTQIASTSMPCGLVASDSGPTTMVACASGESCGNLTPKGQGTCHHTAADNAPCGPDIACLAPAICSATARCTLPNPAFCH